jgi:hypothetical protein
MTNTPRPRTEQASEKQPGAIETIFFAVAFLCFLLAILGMLGIGPLVALKGPAGLGAIGSAMLGLATDALRSGELNGRRVQLRRADQPVAFWALAVVFVVIGLALSAWAVLLLVG